MRISELSPELRPSSASEAEPHLANLQELESLIKAAESLPPDDPSTVDPLAAALRRLLPLLSSSPSSLPDTSRLHLWKLAYRLWNACVDLSNSSPGRRSAAEAELRHSAADLLLLAGRPPGVPSPALKSASFFFKAGQAWREVGLLDRAAQCFEKATDLIPAVHPHSDDEEKTLALDLSLVRARTAWENSDRALAIGLLNRSRSLLFGSAAAHRSLAEEFLRFGKHELSTCSEAAPKLLSEALDLCEKGIAISKRGSESRDLEELRGRCLRFLAAERLQAEDFDGVLKCVRVLREHVGGEGEEHPSMAYMAMRAWLGGGHVAEAERELRGMMGNRRVGEGVLVAAAEAYVAASGAEGAAGVVAGLVGRCRAGGAAAALRVVRKVAEGGKGGGRARVVAQIAADERVVVLFQGGAAAAVGERAAMHALLWNCGADHFQGKDYETSAEMFEKSMLYVPRDEENRSRRSNCFRVLGLCHLALNQLDRAQEFIDEAEKLEPNIKCVFLKFKIYLQKNDEERAIKQMQSMVNCIDFNPEFLTLSAHEAIACQTLPVAVASLSFLLNLYTPGKSMPMPEVALLRNLITLLHRNPEAEQDIFNHTRHARARMVELGAESFFGKGAVGSRELSWFAGNSWNMGLKTGKEKKYELSAEFLELASDFYGAVNDEDNGKHAMVCKSLILSVGALMNVEEQKKGSLPDSDVKKAMEMLNKASKLLSSVSSSLDEGSSLFFLHTFNTYQLLNKLDTDTRSQQLQLIKSFASSKACTPENLLQLGLSASRGGRPNLEASEFAFNACLTALLASPVPDYQMVAIALRKLAGLAGLRTGDTGDGKSDAAYDVYREAYQIIVGLKDGEYPMEEGKWLAMTAWNKSGMAVRLREVGTARRWMKMGLDLARHLRGMEKYIGGMEECFANFEKLCAGSGVDQKEETGGRSQPILQQ